MKSADWWFEWRERDFSWNGLAKINVERLANDYESLTLQEYWRLCPDNSTVRSDAEMLDCGELMKSPSGELWHIAHVPEFWGEQDGTLEPDLRTWKADLSHPCWNKLDALVHKRIDVADATKGSWATEQIDGLDLDRWKASRKENRALLDGAVLRGASLRPGVKPLSLRAEHAAFLSSVVLHDFALADGFSLHGALVLGDLSLEACQVEGASSFRQCQVQGDFNAHRTIFTKGVAIQRFFCNGRSILSNVQFKHEVDFTKSVFLGLFTVKNGDFVRAATFAAADFYGEADFSSSHFHGRLSLGRANFHDRVSFRDFLVEQVAFFIGTTFPSTKPWAWHSAFYQATFKGTVDFGGVDMKALAAFDGVRFLSAAKMDTLPEAHADGIFEGAHAAAEKAGVHDVEGRGLSRSERRRAIDERLRQLEHGCRVLKQSRLATDQKFEALILHRFELRARRLQSEAPRLERWFSFAYDQVSEYGSSIDRPLYCLSLLMLSSFIIYSATLSSFSLEMLQRPTLNVSGALDSANLTLVNLFRPFGVWMTPSLPPSWPDKRPGVVLAVRLLSTLQSLTGITLLFLSGLAMRKRFQIA